MIDLKIQINDEELLDNINERRSRFTANIPTTLSKIGRIINSRAKEYAPYDTGTLANSIQFRLSGDEVIIFVPDNSKAGKYAYVVESDTMFMHRAFYNSNPEIMTNIRALTNILTNNNQ